MYIAQVMLHERNMGLYDSPDSPGGGGFATTSSKDIPLKELRFRIESGEKTEIEVDHVPLLSIDDEGKVYDEEHVQELSESFAKRGQIERLSLSPYITDKEEIRYRIINGFHRRAGLLAIGRADAKAVLVLGCSEEELFDLRVGATTHEAVKYPRMVMWINESFQLSEWAKRGITLRQICGLGYQSETLRKKQKKRSTYFSEVF